MHRLTLRQLLVGAATVLLAACGSNSQTATSDASQSDTTTTVAAATPLATTPAAADPGKVQFLQCSACHAVEANAPPRVGPDLHCVIGRKAGSLAGFHYSPAFQQAHDEGLVWTRANLLKYIESPSKMIPNNAMAFGGVAKAENRQAIVDYLAHSCDGGAK